MPVLKIGLTGGPELVEALHKTGPRFLQVISTKLNGLLFQLQGKIVGKLSGEVLKVRTGILRGSVNVIPAELRGTVIAGAVESSGGASFYGKFHEYGSRPHQITAVKARALRFIAGNKVVFAKSVAHPGSMPRSFMQSTLDESADSIRAQLQAALDKIIQEK